MRVFLCICNCVCARASVSYALPCECNMERYMRWFTGGLMFANNKSRQNHRVSRNLLLPKRENGQICTCVKVHRNPYKIVSPSSMPNIFKSSGPG